MHKIFLFILLFVPFCIYSQSSEELGLQTINIYSAQNYIEFLSDDLLEGREAGTRGGEIASLYIISILREIGIEPLDDYSYTQDFKVGKRNEKERYQFIEDSESEQKCEFLKMRNILGKISGKDSNQYVVIGAHYDHLGIDSSLEDDSIYNGADDNASGVSAVLQVAKACLMTGVKPERTIIFAFWDGEEKGLLGSTYFLNHFPDVQNIKAYLNFDMIGRNNDESNPMSVAYFYSEDYPNFKTWSEEDIKKYNLRIKPDYHPSPYTMGGSDNASFSRKEIPIIWYHTGGHPDYHKPSDHPDKINWEKVLNITKASFLNIWKLANESSYQ